jgi:hypothetical protein
MTKNSIVRHSAFALRTHVGFCGQVSRQEVGGPACLGVIVGTFIFSK